ncbi:MAG: MFS transporter [Candidatus Marinimicrobia bacterium]|nr:MFS transporter [Candidatus Neomarinimicrobiota bacterium]
MENKNNPIKEITEPFVALIHSPRELWGVNISYFFEGLCYFGILTLLAIYFNKHVELNDQQAGWIVGAFTGGITLAMFFLGEMADRVGVKKALIISLGMMVIGRLILSNSNIFGSTGMWSGRFFAAVTGLFFVVIGYGMYQPAAYSAVRKYTSEKSAAVGYAMLYAVMNLGGFLPGIISPPVRHRFGILGVYKVYTLITFVGLLIILILLRNFKNESDIDSKNFENQVREEKKKNFKQWLIEHPLRDSRFAFFIFILIPVQTLFAHQWLTLPQYVYRAYPGFVSRNMEFFVNLNPILIFILAPFIASITSRVNIYKMMIIGTSVMALPTFLLALGTNVIFLISYILLMSIGEAMWQPRFLQVIAELAPEGKTGQYMGIGQFPWFLTKLITSLYSGYFLSKYCPEVGAKNTQMLWFIYGCIATVSPIALILAGRWMGDRLEKKSNG